MFGCRRAQRDVITYLKIANILLDAEQAVQECTKMFWFHSERKVANMKVHGPYVTVHGGRR